MVEHSTADREVTGSNPAAPFMLPFISFSFTFRKCIQIYTLKWKEYVEDSILTKYSL